MKKIIALLLSLCLLLSGCAGKGTSADLTADISAKDISSVNLKEYGPLISDFALRLLQSSWEEEKNILISPYIVFLRSCLKSIFSFTIILPELQVFYTHQPSQWPWNIDKVRHM